MNILKVEPGSKVSVITLFRSVSSGFPRGHRVGTRQDTGRRAQEPPWTGRNGPMKRYWPTCWRSAFSTSSLKRTVA